MIVSSKSPGSLNSIILGGLVRANHNELVTSTDAEWLFHLTLHIILRGGTGERYGYTVGRDSQTLQSTQSLLGLVFTAFDHQPIKLVKSRDAVQLVSQCIWGGYGWYINSSRVRALVGEEFV